MEGRSEAVDVDAEFIVNLVKRRIDMSAMRLSYVCTMSESEMRRS